MSSHESFFQPNPRTSYPAFALYPSLVGLLLGLLQTGLFFQLSFTLSSTFGTFLLVTLSWLAGSAVGVAYLSRTRLSLAVFLALALVAYGVCSILLVVFPFNTPLTPLYAALVVLTGFYPGVFFARMASRYTARDLFFRENNGFIAGLVLGTLLFMLLGRVVLWLLPSAVAVLVYVVGMRFSRPTPPFAAKK